MQKMPINNQHNATDSSINDKDLDNFFMECIH